MLGHGVRGVDGATHKPPNHDSVSPPPTKTTPTTPTPTPPSPTPCATCWALSACSDLIPDTPTRRGTLPDASLHCARSEPRVYGRKGARAPVHAHSPWFQPSPAPTIYRISQPWEVGMEHNRGCNRLQHTWQCPTTPPRQVAGDIWRSRVVAPHREQYGVRAINPLSVISPKMSQGGGTEVIEPCFAPYLSNRDTWIASEPRN